MKTIQEHIIDALDAQNLKYDLVSEKVIAVGFSTDGGVIRTHFLIDEESAYFVIRVLGICRIPEGKREKVYPVINAINSRTLFGSMFIDSDGDIQNIYTCNVDDGAINRKVILTPWAAMVKTMSESHDEIMEAVYSH